MDYDFLERIGAWGPNEPEPIHIMVANSANRRSRGNIACHVFAKQLPLGALMRIESGVYCTSPAFTALLCSRGKSLAEVLMLLSELLGTYSLPVHEPEGLDATSPTIGTDQAHYKCDHATTLKELRSLAKWAKSSDFSTFRTAVKIVLPNAASPMESVIANMLVAPMRYGGFACGKLPKGGIKLNHRVEFTSEAVILSSGIPYAICDIYVPASNADMEYNGIGHELENVRIHDGNRNNGLKAMGITVYVLNRDQLKDVEALEGFARELYKAAGMRYQCRINGRRNLQMRFLSQLRQAIGLSAI